MFRGRSDFVPFDEQNTEQAIEQLSIAEDLETNIMSVLVNASDIKTLKVGYPNFFGDATKFVKFIAKKTSGGKRMIDEYIKELNEEERDHIGI